MTNIKWEISLNYEKKTQKQNHQRLDESKQSSNAYLQLDVGHTGGLVSSPLCFLD